MALDVLFVYGTLKRGQSNHALVASARAIEPARMCGRLYDLKTGYPAAILSEGEEGELEGEALFFDALDELLPRLDEYEGYTPGGAEPSLFLRVRRPVALESGREVEAWVYVMPREREAELVESGAIRISRWR